jgi:hypothetical protein
VAEIAQNYATAHYGNFLIRGTVTSDAQLSWYSWLWEARVTADKYIQNRQQDAESRKNFVFSLNRFDQPQNVGRKVLKIVLNKSARSRNKYSNSIKLNPRTKVQHNSQFLLLPSIDSSHKQGKIKIFKQKTNKWMRNTALCLCKNENFIAKAYSGI